MKRNIRMTTAQFAELHNVNKRTLHYYDTIDLFSPKEKGGNQYRYYDSSQSLTFEYIRILKGLNMSIGEIRTYMNNPNPTDFIKIIDTKSAEINEQIKSLKQTQRLLSDKKKQIQSCGQEEDGQFRIIECEEEKLLTAPYDFEENNAQQLISHIKDTWGMKQCRAGIGSYISAHKVLNHDFSRYDGIFTPLLNTKKSKNVFIKPKGQYLRAYFKGPWDKLPDIYNKIVIFAEKNHISLVGYAYELGMNELVINDENDYVTRIEIQIRP